MSPVGRLYVVIVSFRRPHELQRVLQSLEALTTVDWHLALALNGPDAESGHPIQEWIQSHRAHQSTVLAFTERHDLARARNLLLQKIQPLLHSHDWILFLDDDAFLPMDYAQRLRSAVQEADRNKIGIIGGPNLTPPGSSPFSRLSGWWLASPFVSGPMSLRYRQGTSRLVRTDDGLILCQLLVSARLLKPDLFLDRIWGGEENLVFAQHFSKGEKALYDGQLFCLHDRRPSVTAFLRQIRKYGQGRGQVTAVTGKARWAHLLPLVMLLIIFVLAGAHSFAVLAVLMALEFALAFAISVHVCWLEKSLAGFISLLMVPTLHLTYAFGVAEGLMRGPPRR